MNSIAYQWAQLAIFAITLTFTSLYLRARFSTFVDRVDVPVAGQYGIDFQAIMEWTRSTLNNFQTYYSPQFWGNVYPPFHFFIYAPLSVFSTKWGYLFFIFTSFSMLAVALYSTLTFNHKSIYSRLYTIAIFGLIAQTYPVLFCLERGNSDILNGSLCALFIVLLFKESRNLALIILTIATQIKVFPGLLILFFLLKKDWKRFFIFAALNFSLLFIFGIRGFDALLSNIHKIQSQPYLWHGNHSLQSGIEIYFPGAPSSLYSISISSLIITFIFAFGFTLLQILRKNNLAPKLTLEWIGLLGAAFQLMGLIPVHSHDYKLVMQIFPWLWLISIDHATPAPFFRSSLISLLTACLFLPPHHHYPKTAFLCGLFFLYLSLLIGKSQPHKQ